MNEVSLLNLNYLNGFLVLQLDVIQMTDPFENRFQCGKGMIAKSLNKYNRRSERAFLNSGVTETTFNFDIFSVKEPHKE